MSYTLSKDVWKLRLPTADKIVLLLLADMASEKHNYSCWPSISFIASRTGLSDRTVQSALRRLEDEKMISREDRPGNSSIYRIHPRSNFTPSQRSTPAGDSPLPRTTCTPPPQQIHPTPAGDSPKPYNEPVIEPSNEPRARAAADNGEPPDLLAITNHLARIGGVSLHRERNRADAIDLVKSWIDDGVDIERTAIPAIEARRRETRESSIGSLNFYAGRIAKAHADALDAGTGKSRSMTPDEMAKYRQSLVAFYRRIKRDDEAELLQRQLDQRAKR